MKTHAAILIPMALLLAAAVPAQPSWSASPDQTMVAQSDNAFAVDLYGKLRAQPGNLFLSPASISTALSMVYAGASGNTASEMAAALHLTFASDRLYPAMGTLLAGMNAPHQGYQLHVANALWGQQGEDFLPAFLTVMKTDYGAGLHTVDFEHAAEPVRRTINEWVQQQTADKIKDLLPPRSVTPDTRLVLTNAIYFKGDWQTQFAKAETAPEDFHLSATNSIKVPMMHRSGSFGYFAGNGFQVLAIPYKGDELSMVVLLPNQVEGLPALEGSTTAAGLQRWTSRLRSTPKVNLSLPRFRMTGSFELNRALAALGVKSAFSRSAADFSAMNGKRNLWIGAAVHKAFVDVNEEGTEAAAATGITMRALAMVQEPPIEFRADHPFLFLIRENRSGIILFIGRVADPAD